LRCIPGAAAVGERVVAAWQAVQAMSATATQVTAPALSTNTARPTVPSPGVTTTVTA